MKKAIVFFIVVLSGMQGYALDVSILITQYFADNSPYIEVYLHTVASSVAPLKETATNVDFAERQVKVTVLFKQDNQIIRFDNFVIESGKQKTLKDFVALKRYGLKPGKYKMEFECVDLADEKNIYKDAVDIVITEPLKTPSLSNLQLVADTIRSEDDGLSKNGYFYELVPFGYVNPKLNRIGIYFETYNTDQFAYDYSNYVFKISKREKNGAYGLVAKNNFKRKNTVTDRVTTWFDATYYESGQYKIQLSLLDQNKSVIDSTVYFFTKSNPGRDEALLSKKLMDEVENSFAGKLTADQLNYALRAISMNVVQADVELVNKLIKDDNPTAKTNYIFKFFKDKSALHPDEYYTQYMEVAKAVDKKYKSGLGYGFETDRGLIFMKYGKPNDMITINDDPSSAPYEVWLYYDIPKLMQSNVKFLFFNPFLDGSDYRLLQSNARGEMRNPNWKKELYKTVAKNPDNRAPEDWEVGKGNNRQAEEWLQDL